MITFDHLLNLVVVEQAQFQKEVREVLAYLKEFDQTFHEFQKRLRGIEYRWLERDQEKVKIENGLEDASPEELLVLAPKLNYFLGVVKQLYLEQGLLFEQIQEYFKGNQRFIDEFQIIFINWLKEFDDFFSSMKFDNFTDAQLRQFIRELPEIDFFDLFRGIPRSIYPKSDTQQKMLEALHYHGAELILKELRSTQKEDVLGSVLWNFNRYPDLKDHFTQQQIQQLWVALKNLNYQTEEQIRDLLQLAGKFFPHLLKEVYHFLASEQSTFELLRKFLLVPTNIFFLVEYYDPIVQDYFLDLFAGHLKEVLSWLAAFSNNPLGLFTDHHLIQELLKHADDKAYELLYANPNASTPEQSPELLERVLDSGLSLKERLEILTKQPNWEDGLEVVERLDSRDGEEKQLIDSYLELIEERPEILEKLKESKNRYIREKVLGMLKLSKQIFQIVLKIRGA